MGFLLKIKNRIGERKAALPIPAGLPERFVFSAGLREYRRLTAVKAVIIAIKVRKKQPEETSKGCGGMAGTLHLVLRGGLGRLHGPMLLSEDCLNYISYIAFCQQENS
ncbi:MAG: hypothetical protein ACI4MR_07045 [Candidatus Aphodomorpha sp.]|nr:hypothetical protein [bacterium]